MKRNFSGLDNNTPFDLLVIGGGIFGAWCAYDAALRGLKVLIVDKGDWASGTSSASTKLIHGGLRYLDHFWIKLVYDSLQERELLKTLAPHRVAPIEFLIPIYKYGNFNRLQLKTGLSLYDFLARDSFFKKKVSHYYLCQNEIEFQAPYLKSENLSGGFVFSDAQTDDARFTLEIIDGANRAGAITLNYCMVKSLKRYGNRILGAIIEEAETKELFEIKTHAVVNATGAWSFLEEPFNIEKLPPHFLTKGVHLLMPELHDKRAVLLTSPVDKRVFFMIPWYGRTLLGTTDTHFSAKPGEAKTESSDIEYLLNSANQYLKGYKWKSSDIHGMFCGLRVLGGKKRRSPSDLNRKWELIEPLENFFVSIGGKFTSARVEAEKTVDQIMARRKISGRAGSSTATIRFPWAPQEENWKEIYIKSGINAGLDEMCALYGACRYGSKFQDLLQLIKGSPSLCRRIHKELPFFIGEVAYVIQNEMAITLKDIFRRRIPIQILATLKYEDLIEAANIAGKLLGWDSTRINTEISSVVNIPNPDLGFG